VGRSRRREIGRSDRKDAANAEGAAAARVTETLRRGTHWVVDKFRAYRIEPG